MERQEKRGGWESDGWSAIGRVAEVDGQMMRLPGLELGEEGKYRGMINVLCARSEVSVGFVVSAVVDGLRSTMS